MYLSLKTLDKLNKLFLKKITTDLTNCTNVCWKYL